MTSMTHDGPQITGGVDKHGLTHHAAVIDSAGRHLADQEFPATIRCCRDLLEWMRRHGTLVAVWGEGTGAYGAELVSCGVFRRRRRVRLADPRGDLRSGSRDRAGPVRCSPRPTRSAAGCPRPPAASGG
jgi:hypothetical protein